jgi:hypothetical protein
VISDSFVTVLDKFSRREFKGDQETEAMKEILRLTLEVEKILQLPENEYEVLNCAIVKE